MAGRKRKSGWFIDSVEIWNEISKWRNTNLISDRLGQIFYEIAEHMTQHPRFNRYDPELKKDLIGDAVLKMIRNLHNFKYEKRNQSFSYCSCIAWTSFMDTLTKHYKHINKQREMITRMIEALNSRKMNGRTDYAKYLKDRLEQAQSDINVEE